MGLKEDLQTEVKKTFAESWTRRNGTVIPDDTSVTMGNTGVDIDATVLYADLSGSTNLVDQYPQPFAAEIYKTFLLSAARIIKALGGTITAYDGDRIMAVYVGGSKNTSAVKSGLRINWACKNIIQPAIKVQYPQYSFNIKHTSGIDTSTLMVAKTGVRGSNDLVWVGRAANWAAKLTTLSHDSPTWITAAVYDNMNLELKTHNNQSLWVQRSWSDMGNHRIYSSNWSWTL